MSRDALATIEAAYALDAVTDEEWLGGILDAARPSFDQGLGISVFTVSWPGERPAVQSAVSRGTPPEWRKFLDEAQASGDLHVLRAIYTTTLAGPLSQQLGDWMRDMPWHAVHLATVGAGDMTGLSAVNADRTALVIGASSPARMVASEDFRDTWRHVSAHLAAASRLRRGAPEPEAVLAPDGRLLHAEHRAQSRFARDALRAAARAVDRARARAVREPSEGLRLWRALVDGRWSLVDQFDSDGRRLIVARRNDPELRRARALTRRERQVLAFLGQGHANKLIAYELGLPVSTVAGHLAAAARKLGVRTRVELARLARQILSLEQRPRVGKSPT